MSAATQQNSINNKKQSIPVEFQWSYGGKQVILTGTFDNWKQSVKMNKDSKTSDEFSTTIQVDPTQKLLFKYVVDGVWRCSPLFPTESDPQGNVNNWRVPSNEPRYATQIQQKPAQQQQQPASVAKNAGNNISLGAAAQVDPGKAPAAVVSTGGKKSGGAF